MNKYQKSFDEYEVRDEVKDKIYEKLNNKSFKLSYAIIILGVIGLVSLTSVYAEEISAFFKSWTKDQTSEYIPEETDVNVTSKITNFDDTKLERYGEDSPMKGFTVNVESDYLDINRVEEEIGVKLLKYKDRKASYTLDGTNNKDSYVSRIGIGYETIYKDRDDSEFASQYEQHVKQKTVELSAAIYTKNFDKDDLLTDYWFGYIAEMEGKNNYQKIMLENLGVTAVYYEIGPTYLEEDAKGIGHSKTNELYFVYDDITYNLRGQNMEMEDFINFAKELSI